MNSKRKITTVIFDLGGVLYDINLRRTRDSFSLLAQREIDFSLTSQHEVFDLFESGKLGAAQFRDALREAYLIDATDEDMDAAWNALLVGLLPASTELVRSLKAKYRVALLSNINELHHERISAECVEFFSEFEQLFFSYKLGVRKPQREIFEYALSAMKVTADQVFYVDDSPQHVATARSLGIETGHVTEQNGVHDIVQSLL